MKLYARNRPQPCTCQQLMLWRDGKRWYPCIQHAAIDQDRAIGDRRTFTEHVHDFFHLVVFTAGKGAYIHNGQRYEARPGTVAFISPGERHDVVSRRGSAVYSEVTFMYVGDGGRLTISFADLLSLYAGSSVELPVRLLNELALERFCRLLQRLCTAASDTSRLWEYEVHSAMARVFDFLIHCSLGEPETAGRHAAIPLVREYIQQHYTEPLEVAVLARMAGLSRGYFFRAFKSVCGCAPLAYQQQLRIEAAKTLLASSSLFCNEIARRVGYDNAFFFHRVFRKHVGMTPKQYRRTAGNA